MGNWADRYTERAKQRTEKFRRQRQRRAIKRDLIQRQPLCGRCRRLLVMEPRQAENVACLVNGVLYCQPCSEIAEQERRRVRREGAA